ncbi:MAG: SMC-Scp complex subunit ScpB, partial [Planctomycetes bacterium]|nr:SMC-Scp complex subunit ScpB [Planctomycetota bacterium]
GDAPDDAEAATDADAPEAPASGAETESTASEGQGHRLTPEELRAATEALLFAAIEPLKLETLAKALGRGVRRDAVEEAIKELNAFYAEHGRAFGIVEISGKFSLMSKAEFAPFIQRLYGNKPSKEEADRKLSPALLDTLSIIAYKQPVTRAEVENVRGVGCGQIIRQLMERGSVKPVGKKMDVVGYPLLYGTTEEFLREFGLSSLDELPMLAELRRMKIIDDPEAEAAAIQPSEPQEGKDDAMSLENHEEEGRRGRPQDDDEVEDEEYDDDEEDDDEDGNDEYDDEDSEDEDEFDDDDEEEDDDGEDEFDDDEDADEDDDEFDDDEDTDEDEEEDEYDDDEDADDDESGEDE